LAKAEALGDLRDSSGPALAFLIDEFLGDKLCEEGITNGEINVRGIYIDDLLGRFNRFRIGLDGIGD